MARSAQPAKAYSYLRFSTPEQMKGDSLRRQNEAAHAYCRQHGLELDDALSYRDLGVSAFRGSNAARDAALGQFLYAVEHGVVTQGSYLLVENIDRLSRREAWDALQILQSIVNKGVTVVTLLDRQEYSRERLLREPWCFMTAYGAMIRAHEESATKSRRAKEAYRAAVERARKGDGVVSPKFPSWLAFDAASQQFSAIPARVEIVRRMFRMALEGVGKDSIAEALNREGVPVFGRGKRWHGSYVVKTLNNRAVLGELRPNERKYGPAGERQLVPLGVIKGYYPAIVSKKDFDKVGALAQGTNSPRRGRHAAAPVSNVLGGLARCPKCGEAMTRVNKGANGGVPYLVCTAAKSGAGCSYHTVRYRVVEDAVFSQAADLIGDAPPSNEREKEGAAKLRQLHEEVDAVVNAIAKLTHVAESGRTSATPAAIRERLTELEGELTRLQDEQRTVEQTLASLAPTVVSHRLRELRAALKEPRDIGKANAALRLVVESVTVNYQRGNLEFNWRHGGSSRLVFAWEDAGTKRRGRKPAAE